MKAVFELPARALRRGHRASRPAVRKLAGGTADFLRDAARHRVLGPFYVLGNGCRSRRALNDKARDSTGNFRQFELKKLDFDRFQFDFFFLRAARKPDRAFTFFAEKIGGIWRTANAFGGKKKNAQNLQRRAGS